MNASVRSTFNERVLADVGAFVWVFDAAGLVHSRCWSPRPMGRHQSGTGGRLGRYAVLVWISSITAWMTFWCRRRGRCSFRLFRHCSPGSGGYGRDRLWYGAGLPCLRCVILGGETAEMRALYARVFDVAGTIVGTVERVQLCRRKAQMRPGDVLIGSLQAGRTPMVIP